MFYPIEIAGVRRDLPICRLSDKLQIAAFVFFGDVELTCACARGLLEIVPEHDVIITAEAKGIPLAHEMARQDGGSRYIIARKKKKAYMTGVFEASVKSITTMGMQTLYLDTAEAELMKGKRVLIVDDVISTGESLRALETLVNKAGGIICGRAFATAEGAASKRSDVQFLATLPLFDEKGTPLPL